MHESKNLKQLRYIYSFGAILLFYGCAQILPLNGGKRDVEPPKLIQAIPQNAAINFSAKSIEFTFDEFVQVRDIANQLIITPTPKELPTIEANGKKVIVKFTEDLKPNTTYKLFFGNSISDMHEANAIKNFEYVFSTGNVLDSLKLKGNVINAFNLNVQNNVTVGLYLDGTSDSTLLSSKPLYFTKTDIEGNYEITHLPPTTFKILAFDDKNKNLMYDKEIESLGFREASVKLPNDSSINFKLFTEETSKSFVKKFMSPYYGFAFIAFNKDQNCKIEPLRPTEKNNLFSKNTNNDTCSFYYKNIYDTLKVLVKYNLNSKTDTLTALVLSEEKFKKQKSDKKFYFDIELNSISNGKLDYFKPLSLKLNAWVDSSKVNNNLIRLIKKGDSTQTTEVIKVKSVNGNQIVLDAKLNPASDYVLKIDKGAIKAEIGISNDSLAFPFKTTETDDYSSLALKVLLPKKENYMVQLVNSNIQIIGESYVELSINSSNEKTIVFKNILPGNYFVKVFEDKNGNKIWDTGSFMLKKQAEPIYFNKIPIKLLANWDSESEWIVK